MAKAKPTPVKKVTVRTIVDAAKEAYLKNHTKEQMYAEYDKLHDLYEEAVVDLARFTEKANLLEKSSVAWRKEYFSMERINDHLKNQTEELHRENFTVKIVAVIGYALLLITLIYSYV